MTPRAEAEPGAATSSRAAPPIEVVDLPRDTKVLVVGDSMADALGKPLRTRLKALGIKTELRYRTGSYVVEWAGLSKGFDRIVKQTDPDLVIFSLGGNEVEMVDPSVRAPDVRKLVADVAGRPCVWVATPLWEIGQTGILDVIQANLGHCRWFESNWLDPKLETPGKDPHPTIRARDRWADIMIEWLKRMRDPNGPKPFSLRQPVDEAHAKALLVETDRIVPNRLRP